MRNTFLFFLVCLCGTLTFAQGSMNVIGVDGLVRIYPLDQIDSITYATSPVPGVMYVHMPEAEPVYIGLSYIDTITYSPGGPVGTPWVATMPAVGITGRHALVRAEVGTGGPNATFGAQGICWSTSPDPTISDNVTVEIQFFANYIGGLSDLQPNTTYYARAFRTNAVGTAYGNQSVFTTVDDISFYTPGAGTTDIDGNTYPSIIFGNGQEWMATDLRTTRYANGEIIPDPADGGIGTWTVQTTGAQCAYDDEEENVEVHGRLYNGFAAMDTRNVCPTDWHVPTDNEWTSLVEFLGGELVAGARMKSLGTIDQSTGNWWYPNVAASNESGFNAVPGGWRNSGGNGNFNSIGFLANWWSASDDGVAGNAWTRRMSADTPEIVRMSFNKRLGQAIRCVRD